MSSKIQFLPAGSSRFIVELEDLATTIGLFDAIRSSDVSGISEIVPGAKTLLITFDPIIVTARELYDQIAVLSPSNDSVGVGTLVEIPVRYDGEDLEYVANHLDCTVGELIQRHTRATFTVAFTGFAPGFAYMTCDDPVFNVPRRSSPRKRIPAGSVALAGEFCGVYPSDTPGGWQLLGTTPVAMWNLERDQAALLKPGDRVRFLDIEGLQENLPSSPEVIEQPSRTDKASLAVVSADRPVLFQDLGRPGQVHQGVSRSGAADLASLQRANELVGNPGGLAALEVVYGGLTLQSLAPVTLAVAGAPAPLTIIDPHGYKSVIPCGVPFALDAGDVLSVGVPHQGLRSYLAVRGGFDVSGALGSVSTDTLAKIGPAPLMVGDSLYVGTAYHTSVQDQPVKAPALPTSESLTFLDVVLGPRTDWFTPEAIRTFSDQEWRVTPDSDRVGVRLSGLSSLTRECLDELSSEGTSRGSIQIPANGQPVMFLSDHPLTGGYPVIAVVADHHLSLAAQLPIGGRVRFNVVANFDPQVKEFDR